MNNNLKQTIAIYEVKDTDPIREISNEEAQDLRLKIISAIANQKGDLYGKGVSYFEIPNNISEIYGSYSLEYDKHKVYSIDIIDTNFDNIKESIESIFGNHSVMNEIYKFVVYKMLNGDFDINDPHSVIFIYKHISGYAYTIETVLSHEHNGSGIYAKNNELIITLTEYGVERI